MPLIFTQIKTTLLDLIFPRFCVGCSKEGTWLCPACRQGIVTIRTITCCHCGRLAENGICPACKPQLPLTGTLAAGYYRDPILKEAIHALKYEGVKELAPILGEILAAAVSERLWPANCVLVPVPLHPSKERNRGFNQSELIARCLASHLALPVITGNLVRIRATCPQVELKPGERITNVSNAFRVKQPADLQGKTVILVDDVITTGSTIGECARALRSAGIKRIWAVSIAKG